MDYKVFLSYNIIGGILWTFTLTLAGFILSKIIPDIEKHLELVIVIIIIISVIPPILHLIKEKLMKKKEFYGSQESL